jgi:hypothetical protein
MPTVVNQNASCTHISHTQDGEKFRGKIASPNRPWLSSSTVPMTNDTHDMEVDIHSGNINHWRIDKSQWNHWAWMKHTICSSKHDLRFIPKIPVTKPKCQAHPPECYIMHIAVHRVRRSEILPAIRAPSAAQKVATWRSNSNRPISNRRELHSPSLSLSFNSLYCHPEQEGLLTF